jgi:hypothetical protein
VLVTVDFQQGNGSECLLHPSPHQISQGVWDRCVPGKQCHFVTKPGDLTSGRTPGVTRACHSEHIIRSGQCSEALVRAQAERFLPPGGGRLSAE